MVEKHLEPIIETKDLTISFGGNMAVNHVNLRVEPFTLKSIIGPNGAGKTTLFNLLTGQYKPTEGSVFLKGKDINGVGPAERARMGMGRSFQLTNIFPQLTVLENVRISVQTRRGLSLNFWKHYLQFSEIENEAYSILKQVLLEVKWAAPANSLTHGDQRKLDIAILLAMDPEILLLDEPTSGISQEEIPAFLEILHRIKATKDRTILMIEHKIDMVMTLADTIAVLQDGKLIGDGNPDEIYRTEAVQEAYLGGGMKCE
jgi:branched-chain amino acid transport system ATP-binding protein